MRTLSFDLLEKIIAAPEPPEEDEGLQRLARAAWAVYENELTPRQRACMEMCMLRGLHTGEAAQTLGISPQAVSRHIRMGRRRMANVLRYCRMMLP